MNEKIIAMQVDGRLFRVTEPRAAYVHSIFSGRYGLMPPTAEDRVVRRVLDIGAGCGEFAAYAHRRWDGPWIDCWEPDAELREILSQNDPAPGFRVVGSLESSWEAYQVVRIACAVGGVGLKKMAAGSLLIVDYQARVT